MSLFFKNRHPCGDLSTYIDGQLEPKRAARTAAHLDSCRECSTELAELRELRSALGTMPEAVAPRPFTLTPEQVAQTVRTSTAQYRPTPLVTGLRLGSAGLAMALAVVLVIDAGGGPGDPGRDDTVVFETQALATESRSSEDDSLTGDGSEVASSPPPVAPAGGGDIAAGSTRDPGATPTTGGAAPDETSTPAAPEAITAYDADDEGKGADAQNGPADTVDSATPNEGNDDLLVIEIVLGITAALVLFASVFAARARKQSI